MKKKQQKSRDKHMRRDLNVNKYIKERKKLCWSERGENEQGASESKSMAH